VPRCPGLIREPGVKACAIETTRPGMEAGSASMELGFSGVPNASISHAVGKSSHTTFLHTPRALPENGAIRTLGRATKNQHLFGPCTRPRCPKVTLRLQSIISCDLWHHDALFRSRKSNASFAQKGFKCYLSGNCRRTSSVAAAATAEGD